jgi:phage shock protein PspC (stress-responsive transcriptional regulator)
MLGGVCGGLGEYFGVDPIIFRIGAIALLLAGGVSLLLYPAAWILVPEEATGTPARPAEDRTRALTLLAVAVALLLLSPLLLPPLLIAGAVIVPLAALVLGGLGVWWLVSGQGAGGSASEVILHSALGIAVLAGLGLLAVAGGWVAATAGAAVSAGLVIGAGVALTAAAFAGRARWVVLPALALALPVAFVSAAGIDLRGGFGERGHRPLSTAELRDRYQLGAGKLVIDLRGAQLPPGDTPLSVRLGMGEAVVLVSEDVCVAGRSQIGLGASRVFDRVDAGADVDQRERPRPPAGTPRLVVDSRVGLGALQVDVQESHGRGPGSHAGRRGDERWRDAPPNLACQARPAASGRGA